MNKMAETRLYAYEIVPFFVLFSVVALRADLILVTVVSEVISSVTGDGGRGNRRNKRFKRNFDKPGVDLPISGCLERRGDDLKRKVGLCGRVRLREREGGGRRGGSFLSSGAFTSRVRRPCTITWMRLRRSFCSRLAAFAEIYKGEARALTTPTFPGHSCGRLAHVMFPLFVEPCQRGPQPLNVSMLLFHPPVLEDTDSGPNHSLSPTRDSIVPAT